MTFGSAGRHGCARERTWSPSAGCGDQLHAGREQALFLLGAALTTLLLRDALPIGLMVGWEALVVAVSLAVAFRRLRTITGKAAPRSCAIPRWMGWGSSRSGRSR